MSTTDQMSPAAETSRRRVFEAFGHRNYRYFWIGGLISNSGRWFQAIALPAIVWDLTESAGWVGLAGFVQFLPMAVTSPFGGALADRFDRRRLLMFTQSGQAMATLALLVLWISGVRSPGAFVAVSALAGLSAGLNLPAWQAFVSELVPREVLLNAITLNSMQFNSSRMIGPLIAGVTVASAGPGWAFFVNFVSFGAVLVALMLIRTEPVVAEGGREKMRLVRDFVDTLGYVRRRPGLLAATITVALFGGLGFPVQVLSVVFAEEVFDRGAGGFGLMLTMIGAGAVLASPVVASLGGRVDRSRIQAVGLTVYSASLICFALAPTFVVSLLALMGIGAAHLASASTLNTTIQLQVDEDRRAKVLSVYLLALLVSTPTGQLVLGQLMGVFDPRLVMLGAGLTLAASSVWLGVTGRLRHLDLEGGVYEPRVAPEAHPTYPVPPRPRPVRD